MEKIETIEEFYKRKFDWMPDNLKNEIGHFNNFFKKHVQLSPLKFRNARPDVPVRRV
jgi:AraC family transcriptional regulator, transcriptional activator of pobA